MPESHHTLDEAALYAMVASELFAAQTGGDRIGLELELMPVRRDRGAGSRRTVPLRSHDGEHGVIELLAGLSERQGWLFADDPDGAVSAELPGGGRITLEPAGQIEYSGPVYAAPRAAIDDLEHTVGLLSAAAAVEGIELLACGYSGCHDEHGMVPVSKPRYLAMDHYFQSIGRFGRHMMRGTCSLQINIDFGPPAIASERWRLANMISPSLNAIFANSPCRWEGTRYRSFRNEIWRRLDPSRTGRLYDRPDLDPVADYLRFALDAGVMLIARKDGMRGLRAGELTFRQWLGGGGGYGAPDLADWRLHLTTLFPDVRPRGWMELRSIDALPRRWRGVPVAMVAALFGHDDGRREALERIEHRQRRRGRDHQEHDGFWESDIQTGAELLGLAIPAIQDAELAATASEYLDRFCARGLTPADIDAPINL